MSKILILQAGVLLVVSAISGVVGGVDSLLSALAGGLCYLLPSSVTVLVLKLFKPYPKFAGYGFLLGEGLRIVLALIMMLVVFAIWHQVLVFIPFLFGLLAVSHVVFLVFWKVQRYGK
ncbi:ATP synthase subunit I [Neisseria canis]|uniref:ATP synthase I n=1 Tax=Neisseria canis TaxID=493 RepID=A0A448D6B2_9NEIS|nr:ATP synthase subunit I [Neisseria canis]OSI11939.1 F0F1 ATP synthase subunit I [Neisseria canis]VEE99782.1 ATP synthase I [Neisseria canis]